MFNAVHLYFRYLGVSVRSQLQYRASFIMMSLGQLAATGIEFVSVWVLFGHFGSLEHQNERAAVIDDDRNQAGDDRVDKIT